MRYISWAAVKMLMQTNFKQGLKCPYEQDENCLVMGHFWGCPNCGLPNKQSDVVQVISEHGERLARCRDCACTRDFPSTWRWNQ